MIPNKALSFDKRCGKSRLIKHKRGEVRRRRRRRGGGMEDDLHALALVNAVAVATGRHGETKKEG